MDNTIVTVKDVSKVYQLGKTTIEALKEVSLRIQRSEFISIVGPSGSGKTTLLNLIGCLDKPTKGRVFVCDEDVTKLNHNKLADLRAHNIGFIFQFFNLIPVLSAYENVEYPLLSSRLNKRQRKERVLPLLEEVGLKDFIKHKPNELSGGQRQRVAIARALVMNPEIVLADEPTGNLDSKTGEMIISLLLKINRERGATFLVSTHEAIIMQYANRSIRIQDGRLISEHEN